MLANFYGNDAIYCNSCILLQTLQFVWACVVQSRTQWGEHYLQAATSTPHLVLSQMFFTLGESCNVPVVQSPRSISISLWWGMEFDKVTWICQARITLTPFFTQNTEAYSICETPNGTKWELGVQSSFTAILSLVASSSKEAIFSFSFIYWFIWTAVLLFHILTAILSNNITVPCKTIQEYTFHLLRLYARSDIDYTSVGNVKRILQFWDKIITSSNLFPCSFVGGVFYCLFCSFFLRDNVVLETAPD